MKSFCNDCPDDTQESHDGEGDEKYMEQAQVNICHIDIVKNETGQDDIESELGQSRYVKTVFPVHEVADGDKDQQRKDVVRDNLYKSHDHTPAGKRYRASRMAAVSVKMPITEQYKTERAAKSG